MTHEGFFLLFLKDFIVLNAFYLLLIGLLFALQIPYLILHFLDLFRHFLIEFIDILNLIVQGILVLSYLVFLSILLGQIICDNPVLRINNRLLLLRVLNIKLPLLLLAFDLLKQYFTIFNFSDLPLPLNFCLMNSVFVIFYLLFGRVDTLLYRLHLSLQVLVFDPDLFSTRSCLVERWQDLIIKLLVSINFLLQF